MPYYKVTQNSLLLLLISSNYYELPKLVFVE